MHGTRVSKIKDLLGLLVLEYNTLQTTYEITAIQINSNTFIYFIMFILFHKRKKMFGDILRI